MLLSQSNYCDMKTEDVHCWWEDTLGVIRSCFSYSVAFDSAERKVHLLPWQPIQSMCFEWVWSPDWQRSGRSLKISMPVSSYGPSADDIFFPVFFFFFFQSQTTGFKMFHSDKGTSHNMNHSTRAVATEMSSPLDLYTHTDLPKPNTALAGPRDRRMCDNTGFFFHSISQNL